ncbi:MAG: HAD family phosphatase [Chloroflexi bacterium]|nr:HAD family phosphatase [Chloroflexota bacterium]
MIEAVIFDLDGTLVQTERLKALSYAKAAVKLCPYQLDEETVIEAFKDVVGLSRREVALALVERFSLENAARTMMDQYGVSSPWQAYVQVRLEFYHQMLADPEVLIKNQWPHNVALLEAARAEGCKTALATMSRCEQANRVLEILVWRDRFDFIATRDDVEQGKPNPEIYLLVAQELSVAPAQCIVIEDSPSGVKAGIAAGMNVIAVATPFTREHLHALTEIEPRWVVDDPTTLADVMQSCIAAAA